MITVLNPQKGTYELLNDDLPGSPPIDTSGNGILQTPIISADRSFFIRFSNGDCASSLAKVEVKVFDSTVIFVPNAFTPNNDRENDRFRVIVRGRLKSFHMAVYNRFGNVVYSGNDINGSWDGTLKGAPVPSGVYVYVITALSYENKSIKQRGIITLIR